MKIDNSSNYSTTKKIKFGSSHMTSLIMVDVNRKSDLYISSGDCGITKIGDQTGRTDISITDKVNSIMSVTLAPWSYIMVLSFSKAVESE